MQTLFLLSAFAAVLSVCLFVMFEIAVARTFAPEKEHNLSEIVRRSPSIRIRRRALTSGALVAIVDGRASGKRRHGRSVVSTWRTRCELSWDGGSFTPRWSAWR